MDAHEDHGHSSHPASAAVVVVIVAAIFGLIFKTADGGSWTSAAILATVIMLGWGLFQVLVADRD